MQISTRKNMSAMEGSIQFAHAPCELPPFRESSANSPCLVEATTVEIFSGVELLIYRTCIKPSAMPQDDYEGTPLRRNR
jgi:hypothetical protein